MERRLLSATIHFARSVALRRNTIDPKFPRNQCDALPVWKFHWDLFTTVIFMIDIVIDCICIWLSKEWQYYHGLNQSMQWSNKHSDCFFDSLRMSISFQFWIFFFFNYSTNFVFIFFVVIIFSIWLLIRVCVSFIVTTINTVQAISLQQRSSTKATNDIHIEPRIEPRTTISRYLRFVQLNQSQHGISSARWSLDSYYCNLDIFLQLNS